jgi:hypothetical protein
VGDGGVIINTGSINGLRGNKTLIDYSATRGAALYLLAQFLSNRRIRVKRSPRPWTPNESNHWAAIRHSAAVVVVLHGVAMDARRERRASPTDRHV